MVKPEKNSKLIESVATKLKNEDFQNSLEGLDEQEKNKKEFNKLFGAFNSVLKSTPKVYFRYTSVLFQKI